MAGLSRGTGMTEIIGKTRMTRVMRNRDDWGDWDD